MADNYRHPVDSAMHNNFIARAKTSQPYRPARGLGARSSVKVTQGESSWPRLRLRFGLSAGRPAPF